MQRSKNLLALSTCVRMQQICMTRSLAAKHEPRTFPARNGTVLSIFHQIILRSYVFQVHELDVQRHNINCAIKRILVNKAIDGCNERIMVG